jgi:glucose-1-phosphate thymidylyltransferase
MKAVIPVAGAGLRLRPHTNTQPKPLLPVAGKPIMAFIIEELLESGVVDFVFIIGYLGDKIKNFVETAYPALKATFVVQEERLGLGHAIWTARHELAGEDEILILLGDTIVDVDMKDYIAMPESCLTVMRVQDPREFGVVELDAQGIVSRIVEKPRIPKSNLALVGLYKIKEVEMLLQCLEEMIAAKKTNNGEYHLADGLMAMVEKGAKIKTIEAKTWFDCGKRDILLHTNAVLLAKMSPDRDTYRDFGNSVIIPPVHIGIGCIIENSILGPHVTIGDHARIESAIIRDSIIGSYTVIEEAVLHHSIIGSDTSVKGLSQSLSLGDNTEVDFS